MGNKMSSLENLAMLMVRVELFYMQYNVSESQADSVLFCSYYFKNG